MNRQNVIDHLKIIRTYAAIVKKPICRGIEPQCCETVELWINDALELLEARKPHYTRLEYLVNGQLVAIHHPECPRCFENGLMLWDAEIKKGQAYCHRCGQAVKWE